MVLKNCIVAGISFLALSILACNATAEASKFGSTANQSAHSNGITSVYSPSDINVAEETASNVFIETALALSTDTEEKTSGLALTPDEDSEVPDPSTGFASPHEVIDSADKEAFDGIDAVMSDTEKVLPDLEGFVDGAVKGLMAGGDVPGVVVSIVHSGNIALAKGYGFANIERKKTVDPENTLFRIASISKTFIWTAVMQLMEQGVLDLDTDVNEYLTQFQIPEKFDDPITLRHILTHNVGMEDGGAGYLIVRDRERVMPVEVALEKYMPARVRAPGKAPSYSNWASALAGLIIANQTGMDFETYVERNIFSPLKMTSSTFREPLPNSIADNMSAGFSRAGGEYTDKGFEFASNFVGAGAMTTTASDMAHYMIAHLGDGSFNDGRILTPEATLRMREPLFRAHPAMPAALFGFYEKTRNGYFTYGHGGDLYDFHSDMSLMPDSEIGIFISTNAGPGARIRSLFVKAFYDQYFPAVDSYPHPDPNLSTRKDESENNMHTDNNAVVNDYIGSYLTNRRSFTKFEKLSVLFENTKITASPRGGIISNSRESNQRYIEEEEGVFRSVDNPDDKLIFMRNKDGKVDLLYKSHWALGSYAKLSTFENPALHRGILGGCLSVLIAAIIGSLWGLPRFLRMNTGEKLTRFGVFLASSFNIAFVAVMAYLTTDISKVYAEGIPMIKIWLILPLIAAVLAMASLIGVVFAWKDSYWSLFGRLRYTGLVGILIVFAWGMNFYNLIGPWNA
ncbi:MAG: serine hydrolase [Pseudomonadota bacterium]